MALINTTIPNLISGVSQQSDSLRYGSQAKEQVNAYSSVVEGLIKRPPTIHIANLQTPATGGVFIHVINRDVTERYIMTIEKTGRIRIYESSGVERQVYNANTTAYSSGNLGGGFTTAEVPSLGSGAGYNTSYPYYLQWPTASSNPNSYLQAVTVADYTFLLNKYTNVSMAAAPTSERNYENIIYVAQGAYNSKYTVTVSNANGSQAFTCTTGAGLTSDTGNTINGSTAAQTNTIASAINTGLPALSGVSRTVFGSSIYFSSTSPFTTKVEDSGSGTLLKQVLGYRNGSVQNFQDLPVNATQGFIAQINSDPEQAGDDYYVKFLADNGVNGSGKWEEAVRPAIPVTFNAATMPHALIRKFDSSSNPFFVFKRLVWDERLAGDTATNPDPTFVGNPIRGITFFKNRLGFLTDENVVFSEASEFFSFFRTTVAQLLDSDVIDVATTSSRVSYLNWSIPFNDKLLLFSDQTQFKVSSGDIFSSKTVSISQTTEYENSIFCSPVTSGKNIYFAFTRGEYSGIQEYYVSNENLNYIGVDITSAVSKYISGNVTKIATSQNEQVLVVLSDGFKNGIYVYKYLYQGDQKLQSAWFKYDFGADVEVLNAEFLDTDLYLVLRRNNSNLAIETVYFEAGLKDVYAPFITCLDRRVFSKDLPANYMTYNPDTNLTSIRLPYFVGDQKKFSVVTAYLDPDSTDPDFTNTNTASDYKELPGGYILKPADNQSLKIQCGIWNNFTTYTPGTKVFYNDQIWQAKSLPVGTATNVLNLARTPGINYSISVNNVLQTFSFWANNVSGTGPARYFSNIFNNPPYGSINIYELFTTLLDAYKPVYTDPATSITYLRVQGNHVGRPLWIGYPYEMLYTVSRPMIRESIGQGKQSVASGIYMMRTGTVMYDNTRYFRVEVTPQSRATYKYVFNGTALNTVDTIMPNNPLKDGTFKFPIMAKNDEVEINLLNDSPFPSALVSMDFEGYYQNRATRYNG